MKNLLKYTLFAIVGIFTVIGIAGTGVFVAMQYGLLNVRGSIIERNASFGPVATIIKNGTSTSTATSTPVDTGNGCREGMSQTKPCEWNETAAWDVVKGGLSKDAAIINRVAAETGVPARMIAASVVPEQTRFFTDNREVFKRYFEPLKILGTMSKFSLGVSGIKQDTATNIELYASSATSPFYPGNTIAPLLAYPASDSADTGTALFNRLTDEKNHYYSYLYTAAYLKEITSQWANAGFDVSNRPDVLVTLFNLGFNASEPKANPQVAGAGITTGGQSYSFGYLGTLFYQSNELTDLFPRP
jgi:hypothetical protein